MQVQKCVVGDTGRLERLIRRASNARQRDRFRMVLFALRGWEKLDIAGLLGVAKSTLEHWVFAYRDGGIDALFPRKAPGATPKLMPAQQEVFRRPMLDGLRPEDSV